MITLNGINVKRKPVACYDCPFFVIGKNDNRGFCSLFEKQKRRFDNVPKRCDKIFTECFEKYDGQSVILVPKGKEEY